MEFVIITLFPQLFKPLISTSIIGKAVKKGLIKVKLLNLRDFATSCSNQTENSHKTVDDTPYGGGGGMVIKPDVAFAAIQAAKRKAKKPTKTILLTPQGKIFNQKIAADLAKLKSLVIFCGHFEGVDERVARFANVQISIGDFILTGGETAALVLVDAVTRLVPQVLPKVDAAKESFYNNLLAAPVYTRPKNFKDFRIPEILLTGNLPEITKWRKRERVLKTKRLRPDLFEKYMSGDR